MLTHINEPLIESSDSDAVDQIPDFVGGLEECAQGNVSMRSHEVHFTNGV